MSNHLRGIAASPVLTVPSHAEGGDNQLRLAANGGLRRLDLAGLSMLLYPASELEAGLTNLHLRVRGPQGITSRALLGPEAGSVAVQQDGQLVVTGSDGDLHWSISPRLAAGADAWFWHVAVRNDGASELSVDLVHTADVALAPYANVRINEYYVSQYLDLTPVITEAGIALAVRQNMPGERVPWVLLGCLDGGAGWATDALQLRGDGTEAGLPGLAAELPDQRLQHEHTLATLACEPFMLAPGAERYTSFFGWVETDHPAPTSADDAELVDRVRELPEATAPQAQFATEADRSAGSLFDREPLAADDLDAAALAEVFGADRSLVESEGDQLLAFVAGDEHVTLAAKQRVVLRPHGHILRTGFALTPESSVLTSTVWMDGGFASQVTQGHVSRNRLLSTRRTYLGLQQAHGLRVFADLGQGWQLLERPSAWALRPDRARWIYRTGQAQVEVSATAPTDEHRLDFAITSTGVQRLLLAWHSALGEDDGLEPTSPALDTHGNRVVVGEAGRSLTMEYSVAPVVGRDEVLTSDGTSRDQPWVCCTIEAGAVEVSLTADTVAAAERVDSEVSQPDIWAALGEQLSVHLDGGELASEIDQLRAILPFYEHNAFVHYLSPRGLEQYTGGGWGTRDVCQGPVGLLTAIDRPDAVREVVKLVFRAQNARGDWPQAFDFLPPVNEAGQWDSHGDVVYWPLLMVGEHLLRTADASLLDERVTMVDDAGLTEPLPLLEHLERALAHIESVAVPGRPLPAYGHGDWNDSLQPADPELARQMVSAWTCVLQSHVLTRLADGLTAAGAADELATRCRELAEATAEALRTELVADGEMAGYGVLAADGGFELLVHPRDNRTGLTHGVLPWIHAISSDILDRESAEHHLQLIRDHLWGPDGARLFDRPAAYRGGPMEVFQRAEAATFWGREIGLMYTHAHLRYAEALARFGDSRGLFEALMLANPMGITERVEQARPRQSTCYYSSSDAVFADRYQAADDYAEMIAGKVDLEGGWRIYSSGPGLWLRLVTECLLGVRVRGDKVELDPVLDPRLDGLQARVPVDGRVLTITYRVTGSGHGVTAVRSGDRQVDQVELANPYRSGGALVAIADLADEVLVEVGR